MKKWTCSELKDLNIDWVALNEQFYQEEVIKLLENKGYFVIPTNGNGYSLVTGCVPIQTHSLFEFLMTIGGLKLKYPAAHKSITKKLRFTILKRDNYTCQICGRNKNDGVKLEIDHKIPRSKGGSNRENNIWTTCFDCNRGKRDYIL